MAWSDNECIKGGGFVGEGVPLVLDAVPVPAVVAATLPSKGTGMGISSESRRFVASLDVVFFGMFSVCETMR